MIDLIKKTRTYRRFDENRTISAEVMEELINLARLGGSARNCQPWQYMAINTQDICEVVFPHLGWAGYLSDWKGPSPGEKPCAYVLCLLNRDWLKGSEKEAHFDLGIATQNLLLGAMTLGVGGCRIVSFSPHLAGLFDVPDNLTLSLVIALGYPTEEVTLVELPEDGSIRYWRDPAGVHHVPKRSLTDVMVNLSLR